MPETVFDRIPVTDSSFSTQKYIARVGLLDLFCGLDVQRDSAGEIAGIIKDIPLNPDFSLTAADWAISQDSKRVGEKGDDFFKKLIDASPAGLSWLENSAFETLKESGDKHLSKVIVLVVKNAWEKFVKAFSDGTLAAAGSNAKNRVMDLMKDERVILSDAVNFVAYFVARVLDKAAVDKIRHGAAVLSAVRSVCYLASRACHTVYHQFGPTAYTAGLPRHISSGVYLGRALSGLMDSTRLANAAFSAAASCGVVVAWPVKLAAALAQRLTTLFIRLSEHLRLGRLIGYARCFAKDHGYSVGDGDKPKFSLPTLDAATQKMHERDFDAFYANHIGWFPAAACLGLIVPHGVGDAWSFLNMGQDPRYWLSQGGQTLLNQARFNEALQEMEYLRTDARLYLNATGLQFTHPRFNMEKSLSLHIRDDPVVAKGFWYYLGLIATHGYAMN
ncbi:hypothetical protein AKI39_19920 [Bordetella sp. H567]|uniref:hypothetical protein n=1 Tax=Bordetella sp. H567 TaxID=1697043 RepID=UPI00081C9F05|nr:hypothetical protein [Bordetella sp. H567]AOB32507.1 hypothetical protein AKI39_19920 [Bordetella sp. H567]